MLPSYRDSGILERMSHTTKAAGGTTFIHNGDYSGFVRIVSASGERHPEVEIPFADLRELVLGYLRLRMIAGLEDMSDDTLEQVLTNGTGVAW